jgi:cobalt/nickel transport system permease protein
MMETIDSYAYESHMRGISPGFKAAVAAGALIFCIGANHLGISITVLLTMSAVTVWFGGLPLLKYLKLLKIPLGFLILGTVAIVIEISSRPFGYVLFHGFGHYVCVSKAGGVTALKLVLKAVAALSAMYMLVLSTPASEVIGVIKSLRVPKLFIELMHMIYRFIFVMTDTQRLMKQAAVSRLGYHDFRTSCRSFGSSAGNLFVVSLKKASTYYDAMVARCYDGELLFLTEEKRVDLRQIIAAFCYFVVLLLIFLLVP